MKNENKNTYRNIIITSIITVILIASGIDVVYATASHNTVRVGTDNTVSGDNTAAFGTFNTASGYNSAAFGYNTTASGDNSIAFGNSTIASGVNSIAQGRSTIASGVNSIAFGLDSVASGIGSRVFGLGSNVSSMGAIAFGHYTIVESFTSFELGQYNELLGGDPRNWVSTDPLFVIGNGADNDNRHNAVTVLKNGNFGIGVSNPNSNFEVNGYIELDTSSGIPPSVDCDASDEIGRMKVDSSNNNLYVCTNNGWQTK